MELQSFLIKIEDLIESKKPNQIIPHIRNVKGFLQALYSLQGMIGMEDVKNNIVSQLKYYFLHQIRSNDSNNHLNRDSGMFHTVLLGSPGSGKTSVAEILARIWTNVGMLHISKTKEQSVNTIEKHILESKQYKNLSSQFEKLKESYTKQNQEFFASKLHTSLLETDLFFEKDKIETLQTYLDMNQEWIAPSIYNELQTKINSLENGLEYMLQKNTIFVPREIPIIEEVDSVDSTDITNVDKSFCSKIDVINSSEFIPSREICDIYEPVEPNFIKLRRDDLIGKYVGHTAIKTREALMKGIGKVIFIDEAYELYNSEENSSDCFGMECLSTILHFMNEYAGQTIFIFAGYENLLKKTIFRVQPGLERRIAWTFTLQPYNEAELLQIYKKQLQEKGWNLEEEEKILFLFRKNKIEFKNGGGDTQRLAMYTKTVYSDFCFELLLQDKPITSSINYTIVSKALETLKENNRNQKVKVEVPPEGMYC